MALIYPSDWKQESDSRTAPPPPPAATTSNAIFTGTTPQQQSVDPNIKRPSSSSSSSRRSSRRSSSSSSTDKPIFTGVTTDQRQSVAIPENQQATYIKDAKTGKVIGVQDPITRQSYSIAPTTEAQLQAKEAERYKSVVMAKSRSIGATNQQAPAYQTPNAVISEYKNTKVNNIDPETQKIINQQNRLNNPLSRPFELIKQSFISGATSSQIAGRDYQRADEYISNSGNVKIQGNQAEEALGLVGGYAGVFANTALSAYSITTGINIAGAGASATKTALGAAGKNAFIATPVNIVGNIAVASGIFIANKELQDAKLNILTGEGLRSRTAEEKKAFEAGRLAEKQTVTNTGNTGKNILNSVAFDTGLIGGNKDAFNNAVLESLKAQGASTSSLIRLQNERQAVISSILPATLASGAFSEQAAQLAIQPKLAAGAKPSFMFFFSNIAPAGAGEGAGQTLITQLGTGDTRGIFKGTRRQNLYGFDVTTNRATELAIGAGTGAIVSGVLGGGIGSLAAKGKKTSSKFLEGVGYALDPTEKPSDILQEIITGAGTSGGRRVTTLTPSFVPVMASVPSNVPANTYSNIPSVAFTTTIVDTEIPTGFRSFTSSDIFSNVPTDNFLPSDNPVPADTNNPVPADTDSNVPNDTSTNTTTNTDTNINNFINTSVPVNVPVFTDVLRLPPPLPLGLSLGGGGYKGTGRKSKKAYISELAASNQIFNEMLGNTTPQRLKAVKPKSKKAKTKTTKKPRLATTSRPARSFSSFNKMIFG